MQPEILCDLSGVLDDRMSVPIVSEERCPDGKENILQAADDIRVLDGWLLEAKLNEACDGLQIHANRRLHRFW